MLPQKMSWLFLFLASFSLFTTGCFEDKEAQQEQAELIEFEIKDHIHCQEFASAKKMVLENYKNNKEKLKSYLKIIDAQANTLACSSLKIESLQKDIVDEQISFYGKIKNTTSHPIKGFKLVLHFYDSKRDLLLSDFIEIASNKLEGEAIKEFKIISDKYKEYENCYYNFELVDASFVELPNIPNYR